MFKGDLDNTPCQTVLFDVRGIFLVSPGGWKGRVIRFLEWLRFYNLSLFLREVDEKAIANLHRIRDETPWAVELILDSSVLVRPYVEWRLEHGWHQRMWCVSSVETIKTIMAEWEQDIFYASGSYRRWRAMLPRLEIFNSWGPILSKLAKGDM